MFGYLVLINAFISFLRDPSFSVSFSANFFLVSLLILNSLGFLCSEIKLDCNRDLVILNNAG